MEQEEIKILQGLNPAQYDAVVNYDTPSLIIAGAGSGKTRVLTSRIAYMIARGVAPYRIMALTFTNKAARQMRERITNMIGEKSSQIWIGTFHAIFAKILFVEAEKIGYQPSFSIYDSQQSVALVKSILKELNLSDETYKPKDIFSRISKAKNNLVTAQAYEDSSTLITEDRQRRQPEFVQVYKTYSARCKANNAMDFDDLLLNINILFRDFPEVLDKYRQKFAYILVDEYQDTNFAQYIIIRRLAQEHSKLCVVGDDAQSIYSFRGAKIENIFQFQKDFPGTKIFKLEQNYRSTQNIVDAANSIIQKNKRQISKRVFSENNVGEKIKIYKAYTDGEEAVIVADGIKAAYKENGNNWNEIAVLYRTNAQSRSFEEALRRRNVPYRIFGGHSFYDRKEIKDLLAYFKVIVNPRDDESLVRIINYPSRGIGDVTIGKIKTIAQQQGVSIWEALRTLSPEDAKIVGKKVVDFTEMINSLSLSREQETLYEFGVGVASKSGILSALKLNPSPETESALGNIEELLNSLQDYRQGIIATGGEEIIEPTIEEWLQNISLLTDMDSKDTEARNWVTLMTVHAAKGLEFDTVFIVGVEENLFPSIMSLALPEQIEEERRLFYVALTRAKRQAIITFAESRYKWGNAEFCKPSRFIDEIDKQYVELQFDTEDSKDRTPNREKVLSDLRGRYDYRKRTVVQNSAPQMQRTIPQIKRVPPNNMRSVGVHKAVEASENAVEGSYSVGQKVSHARFGRGIIKEIEQLANDYKITVLFDGRQFGQKSLLAKYAKLEMLN